MNATLPDWAQKIVDDYAAQLEQGVKERQESGAREKAEHITDFARLLRQAGIPTEPTDTEVIVDGYRFRYAPFRFSHGDYPDMRAYLELVETCPTCGLEHVTKLHETQWGVSSALFHFFATPLTDRHTCPTLGELDEEGVNPPPPEPTTEQRLLHALRELIGEETRGERR